ncbi:uncharacterized protein HMPREF1541_09972 [Cyphellophora europaea CBS 101466]|uniref:F-box domain-containing protein n=1 Tax=Cyphellophora europaea (strain CBS 101466) TaxID=1220924 RepID=W2S8P3_CYPE1|nr:uncharacterized protein HMPREF1541_09972 [Cyphellophora europaea CBS 101466]ETN45096.1 hypothetical protein HMPREF1541_09972 [Cyphellophora europaea CBS 101466]
MNILELPQDVLLLVLANLNPKEYLAFCQTSKAIYQEYRQDSNFWRNTTSTTFRLPISPLLAADGPRWYSLYKKLKTQTRLYTWGQGQKGNLGPGSALQLPPRGPLRGRGRVIPHRPIPRRIFQRTSSSWPTETHVPVEVGVIADLQCGGWSTTILSAGGKLYTTGSLDSMNGITIGETTDQFKQLEYLTQSTSRIRQFSSGRRHVLALTDDGEVLSWDRINGKGLKAFSRHARHFGGTPTRVAAGWAMSSAYIPETGIVYWNPIKNDGSDNELDGLHVQERTIPGTAVQQTDKEPIEVTKHVVLEDFIVWITSHSKIYACGLQTESADQTAPNEDFFEVPGYTAPGRDLKDIQGQFHNFGVFTSTGEVLAGNVDYLRQVAAALRNNPSLRDSGDWSEYPAVISSRPADVPTLQHTGVVQLAYGDHHYHALHANGKISSLGRDSKSCGQLGLSDPNTGGRFRGLHRDVTQISRDATLLPLAERRGRQIWFEPEKKDWLSWLESTLKGKDFKSADGEPAVRVWDDLEKSAIFSEWVDQEGRQWKHGPQGMANSSVPDWSGEEKTETDYEDLDPYFAIGIAAAGWHSGALVLMDEDKAYSVRSKWLVEHEEGDGPSIPGAFESKHDEEEYVWKREGFPKVELPDGFVMPGEGEPRPWREGRPSLADLGLPEQQQQQQ